MMYKMQEKKLFTYERQPAAYMSPRPVGERLLLLLWEASWALFCAWTPKPFNCWRLMWLRFFGCRMEGTPYVHPRARIEVPWNLTLGDRSCLGDRANAYSLGKIELKARSTVAQECYLCTGTHKFDEPSLPLQTAPIVVGEDAFLCARAFVLPGVTIGAGALIGACSLVTQDMPEWMVCLGNPCKPIKTRKFSAPPPQQ